MKLLYLDCFSGASGDMLIGALVDAGASLGEIRRALDGLGLEGWEFETIEVVKGVVRATKATVTIETETRSTYADIVELLGGASIDDGVRRRAEQTFRLLAEAEAAVHGVRVEDVHFHEVGALDAIVDVVSACAALENLAPDRVVCSPIRTGTGTAETAHGTIPVPGPAVMALLPGAVLRVEGEGELLTPTGAAIIAAATDIYADPPPFRLITTGYGAGSRDTAIPNVLRVFIGEVEDDSVAGDYLLIETNLDDMSPELVPHVIDRLLAAGARDAWTTPIVMKKGRPALTLSVLASSSDLDPVLDILYSETTTLGVRMRMVAKHELERSWRTVEVEGYEVRVKLGMHEGRITTASPEYEDALKVARITGLPLKEIYRRARRELD